MWPRFYLGEGMDTQGSTLKDCKQRGEWVELYFMAKAAGYGLRVSRPHGDSSCYDVVVECAGRVLRVQVKSTMHRPAGTRSYALKGWRAHRYTKDTVDFFAIYLIPIDTWYILPFDATGGNSSLQFTPEGRWEKYKKYRKAWGLLRDENPRP